MYYFCSSIGSPRALRSAAIKRESGEKPEQTRYCMFRVNLPGNVMLPLAATAVGKAVREGNKSGDLPCAFYFNNLVD